VAERGQEAAAGAWLKAASDKVDVSEDVQCKSVAWKMIRDDCGCQDN